MPRMHCSWALTSRHWTTAGQYILSNRPPILCPAAPCRRPDLISQTCRYKLNIWDVGGQKTLRSYWRNYFEATDGLIWVVDSADTRRLADCAEELANLLQQEKLAGASLLVLANKQVPPATRPAQPCLLRCETAPCYRTVLRPRPRFALLTRRSPSHFRARPGPRGRAERRRNQQGMPRSPGAVQRIR